VTDGADGDGVAVGEGEKATVSLARA